MSNSNIINIVAVVPVKDHEAAVAWYANLLGREADIVPAEGVAEWELAENALLQVADDADRAGCTTVIIGVEDVDVQRDHCTEAGVALGELVEYPGVIRMAEIADPEGNIVAFVQDISGQS